MATLRLLERRMRGHHTGPALSAPACVGPLLSTDDRAGAMHAADRHDVGAAAGAACRRGRGPGGGGRSRRGGRVRRVGARGVPLLLAPWPLAVLAGPDLPLADDPRRAVVR